MGLKVTVLSKELPKYPLERDGLIPDLCRGEGLFGMVVTAELLSLLIVIADKGLRPIDWFAFGSVSLLALWITLLCALLLCLLRGSLARLGMVKGFALSYTLILMVTACCSMAGQFLMNYLDPQSTTRIFDSWKVIEHILITAIPAGILLRYLYLQQQLRLQQRAELESRIQALQSRIRPHFLFNSMNMIASLIGSDPDKAERVVEDLADLFRHALTDSQTLIPLREELSLSRRYMALEQLRLGDRLSVVWEVGDYGTGVQIPCLTIQPVLENAVYHGIQLLPEGGEVLVQVSRHKDRILIDVANPRNPRIQHNKGNKMAMNNVQTRLVAHFGVSATVEAEVTEDRYITHISYPVLS
jgi:two-component system sensor histidine kinase AlgZ